MIPNYMNFTLLYGMAFLIGAMFNNTGFSTGIDELHHPFYLVKLQSNNNVSHSKADSKSNSTLSTINMSKYSGSVSIPTSNYTEKLNNAIHLYDLALKSDPNNPDILTNKGIVLSLLGEHRQAIALYDTALNVNPKNVGALFNKAKILNMTGNITGAIFYFKEASKVDPSYKGELINLKSLTLGESKATTSHKSSCMGSEQVNKPHKC